MVIFERSSFACLFVFSALISTTDYDSRTMAKTGLVLISNVSKINSIFSKIPKYVSQTLYVSISDTSLPIISYSDWITGIYNQATKFCDKLDVRVIISNLKDPQNKKSIDTNIPIDIVMFDNQHFMTGEPRDFIKSNIGKLKEDFSILKLGEGDSNEKNASPNVGTEVPVDYAALGGTFDRLHNGHKILLSEGILRSKKGLTVGVTDVNMIKSKILWELIQPLDNRIHDLRLFLNDVDPSLEYNVVPIQDVYGPTKDDPKLELLIVSEETRKGGDMVNAKRLENKLSPLDVYCIELAGEVKKESDNEEMKVSSSNRRMRLLGTTLKEPKDRLHLKPTPYIIGLTGGIASGKTNITKELGNLGAGIVNCDLLAHELYKPNGPMNATIAEVFGRDVIDDNGEVNRKKLGSIVFSDPTRLIELNNLLWPEIIKVANERVDDLGRRGYKVVVLEAAVLIQAGWHEHCHQVWTSIVPPKEAVKRLMERNNLSEVDANARLASQPSNAEQVAIANVVFSSLWTYEFTASQVAKAWKNLLAFLETKKVNSNL